MFIYIHIHYNTNTHMNTRNEKKNYLKNTQIHKHTHIINLKNDEKNK